MASQFRGHLRVKKSGYHRKGYTRSDGTHVDSAYVPPTSFEIKDRGLRGRGPKKLPKIKRKGALTKLGYHTRETNESREKALRKAVKKYGKKSVLGMLAEQVGLRKRTQPDARRRFEADFMWTSKNL